MKFLLDMGLAPRTAEFLQAAGHDAVHLLDQHPERLPDPDIIIKASNERRTIATFDLDFPHLLAISRLVSPSIILRRLERASTDVIHRRLMQVLQHHTHDLEAGAIVVVDPDRLRVRKLPIE